ncbi:trans-sulfuration enzyme family protein [Planococcus lenghuensis]|uniref:homocysteine desulfhydrase n=1 Tax=Planococcus lenghuensis TaxID=2213202 RepID=A0A1Q2L0K9_9BACL|nr:PLP-dependent aspartate aminotransferase family protein [Planococcus lenghuensis]AQQ53936.1 cystathionine gamma-synthase [Planococcus lenghuensis]
MKSIETRAVHSKPLKERQIQPLVQPIYQTSAFSFNSLEEMNGYYEGNGSYLYTRNGNPNTDLLAQTVADLENAPRGVAASSGTGAILAGILTAATAGSHVLAAQDVYGGTVALLKNELKNLGITGHFVDFADPDAVEQKLIDYPEISLLISESITNPFLRLEDIAALVQLKNQYGAKLMIDNTFATPCESRPYELGADLVVHSATKYLGGHSDVSAGVLVGHEELIAEAERTITGMGLNLSPFESWLAVRGIRTLALRIKAQTGNAGRIAAFLETKGLKVWYPGKGAMVTFELGEEADVDRFFSSLGWILIVPTLAGVETTVSYPYGTSHRALSHEEKERLGITGRIVRLSAGIESAEDILEQLEAAFQAG